MAVDKMNKSRMSEQTGPREEAQCYGMAYVGPLHGYLTGRTFA